MCERSTRFNLHLCHNSREMSGTKEPRGAEKGEIKSYYENLVSLRKEFLVKKLFKAQIYSVFVLFMRPILTASDASILGQHSVAKASEQDEEKSLTQKWFSSKSSSQILLWSHPKAITSFQSSKNFSHPQTIILIQLHINSSSIERKVSIEKFCEDVNQLQFRCSSLLSTQVEYDFS